MNFNKVTPGNDLPNDIHVIVEIPAHADPVTYEVDKETGTLFVDRFMATSMHYPTNYGYIPQTLSEDGDPVDVLVITPLPLRSGAVINARPIGMLKMTDESGPDAKILAVPTDALTTQYTNIRTPDDLSPHLLSTIEHFFAHYKDLEANKWVKIDGWVGVDDAKAEILKSVERYTG